MRKRRAVAEQEIASEDVRRRVGLQKLARATDQTTQRARNGLTQPRHLSRP